MAVSTLGKVVITVVSLAVVAGLVTAIVLIVQNREEDVITEAPTTESPTTTAHTTEAHTTEALTTEATSEYTTSQTDNTTEVETTTQEVINIGEGFVVGVGIADMTGPCADINFMGYADLQQSGEGIHLRQYSRAFIFAQGTSRVVLVTADVQAIGIAVRREVVNNLQELYGTTYTLDNVILTGTHTHSAPGGHLVDFLFDVTILGYSRESFNAYVEGITRSIVRAHENMVPAQLYFGQTNVPNVHMNRSPYAYENNPQEERDRYNSDTDDVLTQVRIVKEDGNLHGVLNWFAIHTTSMNMTNKLISSDNLGYASLLLEKTLNPDAPTGKPEIVAGFFSSNLGDVSPNTRGARCEFSGDECDNQFLLCDAGERCFSVGPGDDMFESTRIIGTAIYEAAIEVLNTHGEELTGKLNVIHQFIEMPEATVARYDPVNRVFDASVQVSGCVPALGFSFGAGTIDGANTLNLTQGILESIPSWANLTAAISEPTDEDIICHAPKPILLATGRATLPYQWHPTTVSATLIWLGDLVIAGVPGEPTTMAGRRIKAVIGDIMEEHGYDPKVVVSGLTNEYIQYVSTFEEYQIQRYEAASTIYGPYTLDIFLNKFAEFATVAIEGGNVDSGPEPEDFLNDTISLITPVLSDLPPEGYSFGDLIEQPPAAVNRGETVSATFVAASPRNDLRQEASHVNVERNINGEWIVVATDADIETKFIWERVSVLFATSNAYFEWTVPEDATPGTYRMVYYGASRRLIGTIAQFTAVSNSFIVQ